MFMNDVLNDGWISHGDILKNNGFLGAGALQYHDISNDDINYVGWTSLFLNEGF